MSLFEEQALMMILKLRRSGSVYESLEMNCNGTKTFKELFTLVWDLEESHKALTPKLMPSGKRKIEAELYMHMAQVSFIEGNYSKALKTINMCIMAAPHPVIKSSKEVLSSLSSDLFTPPLISAEKYEGIGVGEDDNNLLLSMAYAERSFLLYRLKVYEKCLRDIDLALKFGRNCLLKEMQQVLEERKQNCLKAMATASTSSGTRFRKPSKRESAKRAENRPLPKHLQEIERTLNFEALYSAAAEIEDETLLTMINSVEIDPPEIKDPNPEIPSLSNALTLSHEPSKGRNLKATRNIRAGEVLGVERAYAACLNKGNLLLYCSNCFRFCFLPIPCPNCNQVLFCSESCRIQSLQEDHWIECSIIYTMKVYGVGYRNIVYKLFKTITYSRLRDILEELQYDKDESPETFGFDKNGIYSSSSYESVHYLCNNKEKLTFEHLFPPCQLAFFITKLLHLSGKFFVDRNGKAKEPTRQDLLITGGVVLAHIMKVRSNCFGLGELKGNVHYGSRQTVGMGIFPALSLINHSCNASTKAYNLGRYLILRALRPIAAGEEITVSYLPDSLDVNRETRRMSLQKYCFICHCQVCEEDWPVVNKMPHTPDKDPKGRRKRVINKASKVVEETCVVGAKFLSGYVPTKKDYDCICEAIEMLYENGCWPCRFIYNLENMLVTCFEAGL